MPVPLSPSGTKQGDSKVPRAIPACNGEAIAPHKACGLVRQKLIIALPQDSVTAINLLSQLHIHTSLLWLKMDTKEEASKGKKQGCKLSFCLFYQYSGSNDQLFLNHIVGAHYCTSFRHGKCHNKVYSLGQSLSRHMKECEGLNEDEGRNPCPAMQRSRKRPPQAQRKAAARGHKLMSQTHC